MRESTKASLYNDVLLGFSVYLTIFFLRVYVTLYRMHCSCHHTYNHLQFFIINTTIIIISARNKCSVLFYFTFFFLSFAYILHDKLRFYHFLHWFCIILPYALHTPLPHVALQAMSISEHSRIMQFNHKWKTKEDKKQQQHTQASLSICIILLQ